MNIFIDFFLLAFGGIFLFLGIKARNSQRRVRAFGIRTKALVIDFDIDTTIHESNSGMRSHRTTYYHYPIVRFTDEDGMETTQKLNYTDNPDKLNQQIDIMYIKHDEGDYEIIIDNYLWKNYGTQLFIAVGVLVMSIGFLRLLGHLAG